MKGENGSTTMRLKLRVHLCLVAVILLGQGCSSGVTPPTDPAASIRSYCFPFTNGLQYRYAMFSVNSSNSDTSIYQIVVAANAHDSSSIISTGRGKVASGVVLYNFILGSDPSNGRPTLTLSNSRQGFFALEGDLRDSSTWLADPSTNTTATLLSHYDEYIPDPNLGTSFTDVIAVRYHRASDPIETYTLRFFARDIGLILEKSIVGSTTVIGTLQLLEVGAQLS